LGLPYFFLAIQGLRAHALAPGYLIPRLRRSTLLGRAAALAAAACGARRCWVCLRRSPLLGLPAALGAAGSACGARRCWVYLRRSALLGLPGGVY
jgi:hypothetical protein